MQPLDFLSRYNVAIYDAWKAAAMRLINARTTVTARLANSEKEQSWIFRLDLQLTYSMHHAVNLCMLG
jgi:hypothetical protein